MRSRVSRTRSRRYFVLAEDPSDVQVLRELIRAREPEAVVRGSAAHAGGGYVRGALTRSVVADRLRARVEVALGDHDHVVVAVDADGPAALARSLAANLRRLLPDERVQIVVPVREIEAWFLGCPAGIARAFPSWKRYSSRISPESVVNPKAELERLSPRPKGAYLPSTDASRIARAIREEGCWRSARERSVCEALDRWMRFWDLPRVT